MSFPSGTRHSSSAVRPSLMKQEPLFRHRLSLERILRTGDMGTIKDQGSAHDCGSGAMPPPSASSGPNLTHGTRSEGLLPTLHRPSEGPLGGNSVEEDLRPRRVGSGLAAFGGVMSSSRHRSYRQRPTPPLRCSHRLSRECCDAAGTYDPYPGGPTPGANPEINITNIMVVLDYGSADTPTLIADPMIRF